ncbi:MAG: LysR substrate-binding domain-containing protein, partial [Janthinobacterium sp.]
SDSPFAPDGRALSLKQALAATLILPGLQHGVRPRIDSRARELGLEAANVIEINSIAILKSAILAGMGATILPAAPLLAELDSGAMRSYAIHSPMLSRTVALCASKNIPLTNAGNAVKNLVLQVAAELCGSGRWVGAKVL